MDNNKPKPKIGDTVLVKSTSGVYSDIQEGDIGKVTELSKNTSSPMYRVTVKDRLNTGNFFWQEQFQILKPAKKKKTATVVIADLETSQVITIQINQDSQSTTIQLSLFGAKVKDTKLNSMDKHIQARLDYLRKEIVAERISYGEIVELQSLADHIPPDDTLLLEWAGVEENRG